MKSSHRLLPKKPPKNQCKEHGKDFCKDCSKDLCKDCCKDLCKDCCKDKHSKCDKDCLCKLLREFIGKTFEFQTKSGSFIKGKIECVTKDCCVAIIEPEILTPHVPKRITIIRCKDIESFSKELPT
jgi:hypothetical protein